MLLNVTGVKFMSPHLLKINEMNPYSTFINISIKTALPKGQQSLSAGRSGNLKDRECERFPVTL